MAQTEPKSDRLSLWMALILAVGILTVSWLVFDAVAPRPAAATPARPQIEQARWCPAPGPGERLSITIIKSPEGRLRVECDTIHPFLDMRAVR